MFMRKASLRAALPWMLMVAGCPNIQAIDYERAVFAEKGITVDHYIERLRHGTSAWQRYNAAAALGELGDKKAIRALIEALHSSEEPVRENAVASLGDLHAIEAADEIRALLKDPSEGVRMNARTSLRLFEVSEQK